MIKLIIFLTITTFIFAKSQLQEAIDNAPAYSKIELPQGVFQGPISIDKPLILTGSKNSIIQNDNKGTVIKIKSNDVTIDGITIQKSGDLRYKLDSGIRIDLSKRVTIKNCTIKDTLFGIIAHDSQKISIKNNNINSYNFKVVDNRGDGIRFWNIKDGEILNNKLQNGRDISINRSKNIKIEKNTERDSRYGVLLHLSSDIYIKNNKLLANYVGIMIEGGKNLQIEHNNIIKTHLATGTGIMITEGREIYIRYNKIRSHAQAFYISSSTAEIGMRRYIEFNDISYNNTAFHFYKIIKNNTIKNNNIIGNLDDVVKDVKAGKRENNNIDLNYWDKYIGFDIDKDGINDTPYLVLIYADKLWQFNHHLKLFYGTPLLTIVDFIERLAPFSEPVLLLEDKKPRQKPLSLHFGTL